MIILDATTESLEMVLDDAITTSQLQWTVSYIDIADELYTPTNADGTSNNTTDVTIVSSPAASHQIQVKQITVYNADTVPAVVIIKKDTSGVEKILCRVFIQAGNTLQYNDSEGFSVIASNGGIYIKPNNYYAISAGSQSVNAAFQDNLVFSDSNDISFGMFSSSIVTATYNYRTLSQSFFECANAELFAFSIPTSAGFQSFQRMIVPYDIIATKLDYIAILTLAGSQAGTWSVSAAAYTRGTGVEGRSLFTASSTFASSSWNTGGATSNSNSYSGQSGTRVRSISLDNWAFTPGEYWFAFINSATSPSGTTAAQSFYGQSGLSVRGKIGWDNEPIGNNALLSVTMSSFKEDFHVQDLIFAAAGGNANVNKQPYFRLYGTY